MRNVSDKSWRENRNIPPKKIVLFMRYVEKYGRDGQATDDSVVRRMRFVCWITKDTDTHSEYVIRIFHATNSYANAPHYRVYTCIACLVKVSFCQKFRRVREGNIMYSQ